MKYLAFALSTATLVLTASVAFADYGYHTNKYGTGYWRDDSNDGNRSNNANTIGLNDNNYGLSGNRSRARYGLIEN